MAFAGRMRSGMPLLNKFIRSQSLSNHCSNLPKALIVPTFSDRELPRSYATAPVKKEEKIKIPLVLFGVTGNYASALYLAAVKANALDKVEYELSNLIGAAQKSVKFTQFAKDPTVPSAAKVKAIKDFCAEAKFSNITTNFLVIVAGNGRLKIVDSIASKFAELIMAHRGEVKAIVTTVIPIPPEEEKELTETLQDIIGQGKKVKLEQKIDPSILGGLVVEFDLKVFDMSIRTRARQMERFLRDPINIGNL